MSIPSRKRRAGPTASDDEGGHVIMTCQSRPKKALPGANSRLRSTAKSQQAIAYKRYRNASAALSSSSSDELTDLEAEPTDTELGSALSDIESVCRQASSSPSRASAALGRITREASLDDDDDQVESALVSRSTRSSLSPGLKVKVDSIPASAFPLDVKGKSVHPQEYGPAAKKRRMSIGAYESDAEQGDDEGAPSALKLKKKRRTAPPGLSLARTNLGPTQSILEISERMGKMGESVHEITYAMDEDETDNYIVSETLGAISTSPCDVETDWQFSARAAAWVSQEDKDDQAVIEVLNAVISSSPVLSPPSPNPAGIPKRARLSQGCSDYKRRKGVVVPGRKGSRAVLRIGAKTNGLRSCSGSHQRSQSTSSSTSSGDESEAEDLVDGVSSSISARSSPPSDEHAFPTRYVNANIHHERLPGQHTTAKLRRKSPSSLLPIRERRQHVSVSRGSKFARPTVAVVGQMLLAAVHAVQGDRLRRREAMAKHHKRTFGYQPSTNPDQWGIIVPPVQKMTRGGVRLSRWSLKTLKRRAARDLRRRIADHAWRMRNTEMTTLPPPLISPNSIPCALLPPSPPSSPAPSTIESELSIPDSPPVYCDPCANPLIVRPNLSQRPRVNIPQMETSALPAYRWLGRQGGGQYNRRSPSPPPPFNAQTDCQVVIAARFIDDDESEEERRLIARVRPGGLSDVDEIDNMTQPTAVPLGGMSVGITLGGTAGRGGNQPRRLGSPIMIGSFPSSSNRSTRSISVEVMTDVEVEDDESFIEDQMASETGPGSPVIHAPVPSRPFDFRFASNLESSFPVTSSRRHDVRDGHDVEDMFDVEVEDEADLGLDDDQWEDQEVEQPASGGLSGWIRSLWRR